jgi:hypothetical protein
MNCRRVEKLIPLYVEGDLAPGIADRLTSHLDWCGRCNWLADEYKESQSWLRTSQSPEFDEAFLDNLKAGVLSRIDETSARPSLLASLMQQWSRRQILALSAACFLPVSLSPRLPFSLLPFSSAPFHNFPCHLRASSAKMHRGRLELLAPCVVSMRVAPDLAGKLELRALHILGSQLTQTGCRSRKQRGAMSGRTRCGRSCFASLPPE